MKLGLVCFMCFSMYIVANRKVQIEPKNFLNLCMFVCCKVGPIYGANSGF